MPLPEPILTVCDGAVSRRYPVWIGLDSRWTLPVVLRHIRPKATQWLLVADEGAYEAWGLDWVAYLNANDCVVKPVCLPRGETTKSLQSLEALWHALHHEGLSRHDGLLALGGGVVGDLTGMAAATYQRGMGFVQVPTTLLAMVDASVGGKVAIHHAGLKNNVGTFYQPHAVVMDPAFLTTLPSAEWACGWAEVIKTALLEQTALPEERPQLAGLLNQPEAFNAHSTELLLVLKRCLEVKQAVVGRDASEWLGHRMILNLGHTTAHALESVSEWTIPHGVAVGLGLRVACVLAQALSHNGLDKWTEAHTQQVLDWLQRAQLPQTVAACSKALSFRSAQVLAAIKHDKKSQGQGNIPWILPQSPLGTVRIQAEVADSQIVAALASIGLTP
ncbi:MAG: 3-dehydroquinate synthase family protein [Vampirovibrionales bacterium]